MVICSICSSSEWCDGGDRCDCGCHDDLTDEFDEDEESDDQEDDEEIDYEED
jgi:hypothetical protein